MTTSLNASSLFASSYYGLQNAYQFALQDGATGVTQSDLLKNNKYSYLQNSTFSSYLTTNFTQVDKNKDGTITGDEMSSLMTTFSKQGMTYEQLMAMSGNAGVNSQDLNTILSNFRKIDRNGDGKVSMSEINYFNANKQINDKISELKRHKTSDISIMYGSNDDDDDDNYKSSTISTVGII